MNEGIAALGSMIGFFIVMILIFVGAYYVSKMVGSSYSLQTVSSREMRIVDKLALSRDQYLLIVEAGEKALLIGVSPQHMETLAEFDGMDFTDAEPAPENKDFLSLFINRIKKQENHS